MNKMKRMLLFTTLTITGVSTGCAGGAPVLQQTAYAQNNGALTQTVTAAGKASDAAITLGCEIMKLEDGFSAVSYDGDYWFDDFLAQGGATNDAGVIDFLTRHMMAVTTVAPDRRFRMQHLGGKKPGIGQYDTGL